jgi:hypothetical protein
VAQARTKSFGQFLDVIGLLERRHGENVAIVLFQLDLQLFGQVRQFGGILEVLLMFGFEDFLFLRLAESRVSWENLLLSYRKCPSPSLRCWRCSRL